MINMIPKDYLSTFLPGISIVDEIARGVVKSKTALWIICPEFFQDKTCEIAAHFALNELGV